MSYILYILLLIVLITSIAVFIKFIRMLYMKMKSLEEQLLLSISMAIFLVPCLCYIIDYLDIPTKIGMLENMNLDRWSGFFVTYISTIIGTFFSSIIVIFTVIIQLKKQNDDKEEEKRIAYKPMLDYDLKKGIISNCKYSHHIYIEKSDKCIEMPLSFKVENIGLNHARNVKFQISLGDYIDEEFTFRGYQFFIKKEETIWIQLSLCMSQDMAKNYRNKITIVVRYDDMLNNNYEQKYSAELEIKDDKIVYINSIQVERETLIKNNN